MEAVRNTRGMRALAGVVGPAAGLAALVLFCSFNGGGFFAGTPALLAVVLVVALVARLTLAEAPWAGMGRGSAVVLVALGLFTLWVLASAEWGVTSRAILEFDRALAYTLAFALFGCAPRSSARLRALLWAVLGAAAVVAAVGLVSRLAPDVIAVRDTVAGDRLSYPLTYWNALGVFMAIALVLAVHLSSDVREHPAARVVAAGLVPVLAVTLYLSLSRASIGIGVVGILAYVLLARPPGVLSTAAAVVPTALVAVVVAYHQDLLTTFDFGTARGRAQGHHAAVVLLLAVAIAMLVRTAGLWLDRRVGRIELTDRMRRTGRLSAAGGAAVVVLALLVLGVPGRVAHQVHRFVYSGSSLHVADPRARLTDPGNNGRIETWRVATRTFDAEPVRGTGAGTFAVDWQRRRPDTHVIVNAHSLYLETMAELGIVGVLLLVVAIVAILAGAARRVRGPDRALYAAVVAAGGVWALHAGVDWDWQMPAVTLWFFAVGGAALAGPAAGSARARALGRLPRVAGALVLLLLAVLPASVGVSQRALNASASAFQRRDCGTATSRALDSISALGVRPEPYEILGYCDAEDEPQLGVTQMERAVTADPEAWQYRYGLALLRGSAGLDPAAALAAAAERNPREPLVGKARRAFARARSPKARRLTALKLKLPSD